MKRAVRQRCGFGCVFCGHPIYEYDHIEEYATVQEHTEDNLVLLCGSHHADKTRGLMTADQVREAAASPFNLTEGSTRPYMLRYEPTDSIVAVVGGNEFTMGNQTQLVILTIDDVPMVMFSRNGAELLVTLRLHDRFNRPQLVVWENELAINPGTWDIEVKGAMFTVRDGLGEVAAQIEFKIPHQLVIHRAVLRLNGAEMVVTRDRITINGAQAHYRFEENQFFGHVWAFAIGYFADRSPGPLFPCDIDRYRSPIDPPSLY